MGGRDSYSLGIYLVHEVDLSGFSGAYKNLFKFRKKDKFVLKDVLNTQDFDESILQDMQGKQGITITTVQPYGKMEVEGKQIDVCSEGGYIEKNKIVQIVQIRGKIVVVKEV